MYKEVIGKLDLYFPYALGNTVAYLMFRKTIVSGFCF